MFPVLAALMAGVADAQTKKYYLLLCLYRFDPLFLFITLTKKMARLLRINSLGNGITG